MARRDIVTDTEKVELIKKQIKLAEKWNKRQMLPTSLIAVNTFRAIRRIVNQ
jgi:hypothetical protein